MNGLNLHEMEQLKQIEEMKKQILTRILTKEAYERLARVRSVNPNLAGQVELYLLQIYQSGRLNNSVTDEKMKEILNTLTEKKEMNIRRK